MYLFFDQWLKSYVSCTTGDCYKLAIFCLMQSITINVVCNIIVWEALYLPFPAFYWNYLATEILQHQKFPELQYSYSLASSSLLQYWVQLWQLLAHTVQCYLWLFSWRCRNWYPAVSCAASAYLLKERIAIALEALLLSLAQQQWVVIIMALVVAIITYSQTAFRTVFWGIDTIACCSRESSCVIKIWFSSRSFTSNCKKCNGIAT